jgi:hypothetical protein
MTEPNWWPRDPTGYLFLGRAVEKIGATRHDDWTGTELSTENVTHLPMTLNDATYFDRQRADILLSKHRPDLARPDFKIGEGAHEFTEEHWRIACELAQRLHAERRPAIQRLRAVQDEIVRQSIANELILRIRQIAGGPWKEFQQNWWNMDKPEQRFARCTIDPDYPYSARPSWKQNHDHWIFATLESLDRILKFDPRRVATPTMKPASEVSIRAEIKAVYDEAEGSGRKPPNNKELPKEVRPRLNDKGFDASANRIMEVGTAFQNRRRLPGATLASERRRPK